MCNAKPGARCLGHAQAALDKHHEHYPALRDLSEAQVRQLYAQAITARSAGKAKLLSTELDLRLDRDATAGGVKALRDAVTTDPTDADAWWRYNAASATLEARTAASKLYLPTGTAPPLLAELADQRERLARAQGRAAASLAIRGTLTTREVRALSDLYEATLRSESIARLSAAGQHPDPNHTSATDTRTWRALQAGADDGLKSMAAEANELAERSHRLAAIATWAYAHQSPDEPYKGTRSVNSPLVAADVAVLASMPVSYDAGVTRIDASDPALRERLWHAGYQPATLTGPILLRAASDAYVA